MNRYEVEGDVTKIHVLRLSGEKLEVIIDTEDLPLFVDGPSIYVNTKSFYPTVDTWKDGIKTSMYVHRMVTKAPKGTHVDHQNHEVLDNRKCNLKVATRSENLQNRAGASSNSKSGIRGVSWHKKAQKWVVQVGPKGSCYLGLFTSLEEAEVVAKEARARLMPNSIEARELKEQTPV